MHFRQRMHAHYVHLEYDATYRRYTRGISEKNPKSVMEALKQWL